MTIWFTSDTHFYHKQIIEFCNRPVPGIWEKNPLSPGEPLYTTEQQTAMMNDWLIANWRAKVKPTDEIYHLGDFFFCGQQAAAAILKQLPGRKHWIKGNHDYKLTKQLSQFFESIQNYKFIHVPLKYEDDDGKLQQYNQPIALFHFPIMSWDGMAHGSWHLHGHCHGSLADTGGLRLDMGVDCWNYNPVSIEEVQNEMALRSVRGVDHHDARENNPRFKHLLGMKKN